jgi:hypothetical protein
MTKKGKSKKCGDGDQQDMEESLVLKKNVFFVPYLNYFAVLKGHDNSFPIPIEAPLQHYVTLDMRVSICS